VFKRHVRQPFFKNELGLMRNKIFNLIATKTLSN
jgi:hypothetical protein